MTFVPAVNFNYSTWVLRFPEFSGVSNELAQLYFDEASMFIRNTIWNIVPQWMLPTLLNLMTAHLAWLYAPRDADGNPATTGAIASPITGQITNAAEGSVNVAAKANSLNTAEWYAQTKYGYEFWQATAGFRTMQYSPRKTRVASTIFPFSPQGQGWPYN